uniref:Parathyroid hormone n=1 Tax=Neolamprologus brichardi TaxID=32507 RepID=A0A3Q4M4U6_NEOBR
QVIKMGKSDYKILLISLCLLHFSVHCQGRPLSKRTVSEVQFMHNLGEHKQVQERREWLQMRLRGIHTAGMDELSDLTSDEIQHALNVLDELLKSE